MTGFSAFAAASSPTNANNNYEPMGFGSDGAMTVLTSHATANLKATTTTAIGTTANAWSSFVLELSTASTSSGRFLIDIYIGGVLTFPDIPIYPGAIGTGITRVTVLIPVPTGTVIGARVQAGVGSATVKVAIQGTIANAGSAPNYTTCTRLQAADGTATRATTADVPLSSTWTQVVASSAAAYGAFLLAAGENGTTLGTAQTLAIEIGVGASGSEVVIGTFGFPVFTAAPAVPRAISPVISHAVAAGSRISLRIKAAVAGTDNLRVAVFAYS